MSGLLAEPFYEDEFVTVFWHDSFELMDNFNQDWGFSERFPSVDHLITDPPYAPSVHDRAVVTPTKWEESHETSTKTGEFTFRDLGFGPMHEGFQCRFWEILPVIKRWALIFSDCESAHLWQQAIAEAPSYVNMRDEKMHHRNVRTMFWHKQNAQPQLTGDRPAAHVEAITVTHSHTKMKWNGGGSGNLLQYPIAKGFSERFDHSTPKPLALVKKLISLFTDEGDLILDPFGGTGTTARACKDLKRKCVTIEKDKRWCEVIAKRCKQGVLL